MNSDINKTKELEILYLNNDLDGREQFPFYEAANLSQNKRLKELLVNYDHSNIINFKLINDETALHRVVRDINYEAIKWLLDAGIDINIQNIDGNTALHHAICFSDTKLVDILLQKNPDLTIKNNYGKTAFFMAFTIYTDPTFIIGRHLLNILENRPDFDSFLNDQNNKGETLCHLATRWANVKLLELLLEYNANVFIPNYEGKLPVDVINSNYLIEFTKIKTLLDSVPLNSNIKSVAKKS